MIGGFQIVAKELYLRHGEIAVVDDDVYEWAKDISWMKRGEYVYRSGTKGDKLASVILERPAGYQIRYINEDPLDNRRENLKVINVKGGLVGQRFGKLTVLSKGEDKLVGKVKKRTWECLCDCGEV